MHPFASYVLRTYYRETGWNEDNLFANFTRSSSAILDFAVPRGLHLSIAKSPNALFKTTYSMNAMPSLNGSVGYIFTSCDLNVKNSGQAPFKDLIDRFHVYDHPRRPEGKEEEWLAGERVDSRDYLMYGRLYIPTGRLDALYSLRVAPTLQLLVAAISDPPRNIPGRRNADVSNVMINLQHDIGKWCTEYTWSAEDSMWGMKVLRNFGKLGGVSDVPQVKKRAKRVDEEDAVEGGLRGRISAGAELYFSAKEKSAGISTGVRFTTLPDATPPSFQPPQNTPREMPSQPPTTITALFNPMLGHLSAAYTACVSRDLSLASRFDFNVYSYESEWAMGAEWWLRRSLPEAPSSDTSDDADAPPPIPTPDPDSRRDVIGVIKARASTNNNVSLMWEGRLRNMLISLGVVSNLSARSKPIQSLGLELSYFSSA
ncbi:mitochondrial distribution and morphology protein 10 [Fistulina hepatica ATCC 64428]|uniref:Mitochondrial distribution and morphology protein 10 n=1 Tax=Fistulina hepatica ATCC 64428 TaxID=1128425 RepID=A0A0D7AP09_9AGAR|nr:mitochondrial distribution and morphology protein 10 [Fistulina hepatica ATCC 64428]